MLYCAMYRKAPQLALVSSNSCCNLVISDPSLLDRCTHARVYSKLFNTISMSDWHSWHYLKESLQHHFETRCISPVAAASSVFAARLQGLQSVGGTLLLWRVMLLPLHLCMEADKQINNSFAVHCFCVWRLTNRSTTALQYIASSADYSVRPCGLEN